MPDLKEKGRAQELEKLYNQAKSARQKFEGEWYLNLAYYTGDQWSYWSKSGRLDKPKVEPWRIMLVDNRIMPVVLTRVARKTKSRPVWVGIPHGNADDAMESARLSENVLYSDWHEQKMQMHLMEALLWAEIVCAGFWKISWDSEKGSSNDFIVDEEGQPMRSQDGHMMTADFMQQLPEQLRQGMQVKTISQGDIRIETRSPWELFPDPLATNLNECRYIIDEKVRSKEYLVERYGEKAKKLKEDAAIPSGITESRFFPSVSKSSTPGSGNEAKGVKTKEIWMESSDKEKGGKWAVWAGDDTILMEEKLDDAPFDGNPFVMFTGIPVPGRFWPTSLTSQLRGPQTELNKIKSQIRESAVRLGNPQVLMSRQANVSYSGAPGGIIWYDDTSVNPKPDYLRSPEMPTYVQNEIERIEHSIQEISGLHEVSKATVPSGVTAASAINLLQEADDTRLGPEIQDMEDKLGRAGTKVLRLRAKFADDERIIRLAGEDGDWHIESYRGEMLKDVPGVEVQAGSAMPHSKAAKQAAMIEVFDKMLQYGVELDARDLRKFFKEYQVGGIERLFSQVGKDEQQIVREHRRLTAGEPIEINGFDNHDYHIDAHEEFQKTSKYEKLPEQIKQVIITHVQAHTQQRMLAIQQQLEAQQREMEEQLRAAGQANGTPQQTTPSQS